MGQLSHSELTVMFLALAVLLAAARLLGEIAKRLNQPAVLGEIMAGILLGPTVFGAFAPGLAESLFPTSGPLPVVLEGLTTLAIALFLLVAGMEVDLSTVWRQGKAVFMIGVLGMLVPFAFGFFPALVAPAFFGAAEETDTVVFALFVATAMCITALPVIAKILMDLNLFRTDLGMIVVASAIFNDLVGWIIFAMVLALIGHSDGGFTIGQTILLTLGFTAFMLTLGRVLVDRALPWVQAHTSWPGGVLGFALSLALLCAAFTEWIGIHAIFGAFLFGVALGDSRHLRERTRTTIDQFVSFIFAPLFFASIGLRVDFAANFDPLLVVVVLVIATIGKTAGCFVAARWAGFEPRHSWAIGFGMNARGAMEIILGLIALQAGIINEALFVALVVMALVTSVTSGTLMQWVLQVRKAMDFTRLLTSRTFVPELKSTDRREAIDELCRVACQDREADDEAVARSVWAREELIPTGIGNGVAVPHARIADLPEPLVAVGISKTGIDFDAPDGRPAKLIILLLTPFDNPQIQLDLLGSVAQAFQSESTVEAALAAPNLTEFQAVVRSEGASSH